MGIRTALIFLLLTAVWKTGSSAPSITYPKDNTFKLLLNESTAVDSIVFQCIGSGVPTVSYNFFGGNQQRVFSMDAMTCEIHLALPLDTVGTKVFSLNMRVTDSTGSTADRLLTVEVRNPKNKPPTCTPNLIWGTQNENTQANTAFASINCTDPDTGPNGQFNYTVLPGADSTTIGVSRNTNTVFNLRLIDVDTEKDTYQVQILVYDFGNPSLNVTLTVILSVKDVDDNRPIIDVSSLIGSVKENEVLGFVVLRIIATDADRANTTASLIILQVTCIPDWLMVDRYSGNLIVKNNIDFETSKTITCTIVAYSGTSTDSSTSTFTISVIDVNDGFPEFDQPFYSTSVNENEPAGTSILIVVAHDPENTTVHLSISGVILAIDQNGVVTLISPLDYEQQTSYLVELTVTDSGNPPLSSKVFLQLIVRPVNEYTPIIIGNCSASVKEDAVVGTFVSKLTASDDDKGMDGEIYFIIQTLNVPFSIDRDTGIIQTTAPLNYEQYTSYSVVFVVSDKSTTSPKFSTITCDIKIINVDDQSLECMHPDTIVMKYPFPLNKQVGQVSCWIPDNPKAAPTYAIVDGDSKGDLQCDPITGAMILKNIPGQQIYNLTVAATYNIETKNITVIVFAEMVLTFTNLPNSTIITEGQAVGLFFTVQACCVFSRIEFRILSGNDDLRVTLTTTNGQLRLMVPYDREYQSLYVYEIEAKSLSGQTAVNNYTVTVNDTNDNNPVYQIGVHQKSVVVTLPVNSVIDTITATDRDAGLYGLLSYSIASGNTGNTFGYNDKGQLILLQPLNSATTYTLELEASDWGTPSLKGNTLYILTVVDDAKHPVQFVPIGQDFFATLSEDAPLGGRVFELIATDNSTKPVISYIILAGNVDNTFIVVTSNGTVYLARFLDRERNPSFKLNVSAFNGIGVSVNGTLTVNVTDVNDNSPECSSYVNYFTIPDQTPAGVQVGTVNATDPDLGENGTTVVTIVDGNTGNAFTMNGNVIVTNKQMDYPVANVYQITVRVADLGAPPQTSVCIVVIAVLNRYIPFCNKSSDTVDVAEDKPLGYQVYDIDATGKGAVEDGGLLYAIASGNTGGDFAIRQRTGEVVTANTLDYERTSVYIIVIVASNSPVANPADVSTCTLTVSILNLNECDPVFNPFPSYTFNVPEDARPTDTVGTVSANDCDSGVFGVIIYLLTGCSQFRIESTTGIIRVNAALSYLEIQVHNCNVTAMDGGSPARSAIAVVVIIIIDINNFHPVFVSASQVSVSDSTPVGAVIFCILATDKDTGAAGNISYEFVNPSSVTQFSLDKDTGIMHLLNDLDAAKVPSYSMLIRASDRGTPSLDNVTTFTVNVLASNPNRYSPEFANCSTNVVVKRTAAIGTTVQSCTATDKDSGVSGVVKYIIFSGNEDGNFIIGMNTGIVTTATDLLKAGNSYTLVILAVDLGTPSRNATFTVVVTISPAITGDYKVDYNFTILENSPQGTIVGLIVVTDGRTVTAYSIVTGNYGNTFGLSPSSNNVRIIVNKSPDREEYPFYALVIRIDSDAGTLTIVVAIDVIGVNDVPPTCSPSPLIVAVPEHTQTGQIVARWLCTDGDLDAIHRNITLHIQPPGTLLVDIDQFGVIRFTSEPDYETKQSWIIIMIASDGTFNTTGELRLTLFDIPEEEMKSLSDKTNNSVISLETPHQAPVGHVICTLKPEDFGLTTSPSAVISFDSFDIAPIRVNHYTGSVTVSGSLTNQTTYLLWCVCHVTEATTNRTAAVLMRVDTFDQNTQMIVMEGSDSYTDMTSNIQRFTYRAQEYFDDSQRIGICYILDTSTNSRRRLLAQKSAAFAYVVANRSIDEMRNINERKTFLSQKQMLNVLQQSPDGTPVVGLSDPSVLDVTVVEPYEGKSTKSSFEEFIDSPAGIAVFCLLGLLILVLIILLVTCIFYRKCNKKNSKTKTVKEKAAPKKKSFSKMPQNSPFFTSTPHIIVSAPPPVTQQNSPPVMLQNSPPEEPYSSSPEQPSTFQENPRPAQSEPRKEIDPNIESGLPSQYAHRNDWKNPATKIKKTKTEKTKVKKIGKSKSPSKMN